MTSLVGVSIACHIKMGSQHHVPIYLVSPWWFVTSEHIISDSASTSSSPCFSGVMDLRFSSLSRPGSGDVKALWGVESSWPDVA
jgi:hypothetical protein